MHGAFESGGPGERAGAAATLGTRLAWAAEAGTGGLIYVGSGGEESRQTYAEFLDEARRIAAGLQSRGVGRGRPVILQLELAADFLPALWGAILAGAVPTPVAVAPTYAQANGALQKLLDTSRLLEGAMIVAAGAACAGLQDLPAHLGSLDGEVVALAALRRHAPASPASLPAVTATDPALLLLTSGSTGRPKGVPLTHGNLLAMAAGTIQANGFTAREVTLNWMALEHVGAVSFLGTMAVHLGCTQIHVPTGFVLQDPLRWLDLIARHRATISWAPNFAFTLLLERAAAMAAGHWDLGSMRFLVNAGEPVVARTARRFLALLHPHGLPGDALRPAFGMSETCSGITWSRGLTLENTADDTAFVSLGPCIPGAAMRVVDDRGEAVAEGVVGLLQLRGPSVFGGYYRNPAETAEVLQDGWFTTGDLAFVREGGLYITGRKKDVIIVNGANFYSHEIEAVAERVPGVIKTHTAACAVREPGAETDQLALFFCLEGETAEAREGAARALRARLIQEAGVSPSFLIAVRPGDVPKTEIGKIQRSRLRQAFEAGEFRDRVIAGARRAEVLPRRPLAPVRNRVELAAAIAQIWREELGVESVGHDETFFELGGHSLLVVKVQIRLQELIGRPVPVVELFNCPTVRTMADHFARELTGGVAVETAAPWPPPAQGGTAPATHDIAIVGLGLRFPGAATPEEFWQILAEGRETIRTFSAEEALAAGVAAEVVRSPSHVRAAPMLEAPEAFDAGFFRYSAKEARLIDPQQRVFLEVCWEAFEDAGYDPLTYSGKVGVFAAAGMNTYLANNLLANPAFLEAENGGRMLTVDSMGGFNVMITNDKDYLPTRVSYKLNLRGPSVNVQSACSSTLLTLHQACNSLRAGDCAMALAGGVSIKLPQHAGHLYSAGMLNSPDGHCRAYDEKAEGTIFGNGAGVVLLKPLADAVAAGDRIYAVVKATASNNDGAGKVGYTAPSAAGEEEVCAEALRRAGVSADTVTFMEGHGTGTALGDPIEVNALAGAFRRQTDRTGYCALGSVKTNVGHLQIASGVAGLIKAALALHHRQIPGTIHFEKPNPRIDFARTPFFVNRELIPWEVAGGVRRAGVNSLGIGGTNVHAILEEAPAAPRAGGSASEGPQVLPLSAKTPAALRQLAARYAEALAAAPMAIDDVAFTAQVGRAALPVRAALVGSSGLEWVQQLRALADGAKPPAAGLDFDQQGLLMVFMGGEGSEPAGGRRLHAAEPVYREAFSRVGAVLAQGHGIALPSLPPATENRAGEPAGGLIDSVLRFACEEALAELLASYGIAPAALAAAGMGEYVAARQAGVLTLDDALRLIVAAEPLRHGGADHAAVARFRSAAAGVRFSAPRRRVYSLATGAWLESELMDPEHWLRQAGSPAPAARLEALAGFPVTITTSVPAVAAGRWLGAGDFPRLLADLFALGYPVQWSAGRRARPGRRVALPLYPWQRQAYWVEGIDLRPGRRERGATASPALLGRRWHTPRLSACVYESRFDPAAMPLLDEHRVHGCRVVPGALYLAQVAMQAEDHFRRSARGNEDCAVALADVVFVAAMAVDPAQPRTVQTVFTPAEAGGQRFEVISWPDGEPQRVLMHAIGRAAAEPASGAAEQLDRLQAGLSSGYGVERHYEMMHAMAVELGPSFRWIQELRAVAGSAWLRLERPAGVAWVDEWHPGLIDSFLQAAAVAGELDGGQTMIPFQVERVVFYGRPENAPWFARAEWRRDSRTAPPSRRSDLWLYDAAGRLRVEVRGLELRAWKESPESPQSAGARSDAPAETAPGQAWQDLPVAERTEAIERLIRESVAAILGLPSYQSVDRATGLFDLGIDSLTAIDLKVRLEKALGQGLRTTVAFDYPTPAEMAAHLAVTLGPSAVATGRAAPLGGGDVEALLERELRN
jgi:microcystin synthetase protein McyG